MQNLRLTCATVVAALFVSPASAGSFCDDLKTMVAGSPSFASLRGEASGMQYHGALKFSDAEQCEIRNKARLDDNWQPIGEAWSYECLWENKSAGDLPKLKTRVAACLPDAQASEGTRLSKEFPNFIGATYRVGDTSVVTDFNKDTNQLWLTILPPGVEQ